MLRRIKEVCCGVSKRLCYDADSERVFYRPLKRRPGDPDVLEWTPLAFLKRLAPIIAPPRLNLVRYAGALMDPNLPH